ncbi:carboxypeptidase-like regulatory domain-containing protein [Singulisphaera sp. Ch08]|uniref:Carboxypeptidase-like regulatory domain-containing protein n=1 Tax=Singulisphaera sp. Ch08 TaxID=3120278 RepID=A0AAU7CL27_9BACT
MFIVPLVWVMLAQVPMTPMTGTVVDPEGKPVVGADLILVGLPSYDPPVVARGQSGEGGRFTLDRPTALAGDHHPQRAPILWAVKSGFRVSVTRFPEALPKPDEPVRIALEPPARTEVRVVGPDGRPLAGARVLPERLKTHFTVPPDVVAELIAATTGPDGLAVINAVSPAELAYVDVHSREFGIQGRPITPEPGKPTVIAMRPVSTWKGRLSSEDLKNARGWRVRAWSRVGGDPTAAPETTGYVVTTTDDEGRFTLAPIALGNLQLNLKPPGDLAVVADPPQALAVREGQDDLVVDIPLKKTATVTGLFLEQGTGKPVPGVSVVLIYLDRNRNGSLNAKTDERGRYTFQSLPGRVRVGHFTFPPTHVLAPSQGWEDFTVPDPPKVIELATRELLPAAPPLRGQVVDEAGQAVPDASIQATWMLAGASGSSSGAIQTKADAKGGFVLEGLGPDSTVTINARLRDRQTKSPLKVQAGELNPLTVTIVPTPVLAVAGRVVGPGGAPLAELPVKVQFRVARDNSLGHTEQARFEDNQEIRTGPDGTFRTPKELERKATEFRAEVTAPGYFPARTDWTPLPETDLLTLPDLSLKRVRGVRVVTGRVIDRAGQPVPGALVSQAGDGPKWTSAKVDADGRFRLSGVASGAALVCAEAPEFRFGGAIVGGEAEPIEIRLARLTEPPIAHLKTLPSPLSRAEERALARELLGPVLPLAWSGTLGIANASVIPTLARVAPGQVLEMIENRVVVEPTRALIQVALGQFEDDPALAIATVEADLDPGTRAIGWLALEDFRPPPDRVRRENFLERALTDARQTASVGLKVNLLGQIADRWLDRGAIERARPILLEGQEVVAAWPKENWLSESEAFAEVLAAIDLPAAVALFKRQGRTNVSPTDPATLNRHNGQAAIRLARIDPAQAERLIAPPSLYFYDRPGVVLKATRAMAKLDLARARRVLETIDDQRDSDMTANSSLVPFGLGWLADGRFSTNPVEARRLLDEAFVGLRQLAVKRNSGQGRDTTVATLMAELLPVVERLDPERLTERIWLVAASRAPSILEPNTQEVEGELTLPMLVARYDRAIAVVFATPVLERFPDLLVDSIERYRSTTATLFKSLAVYDPRAIVPMLQALPDAARKPGHKADAFTAASLEAQLRLAAALILGFPSEARPREAGRVGDQIQPFRWDE